MPTCLLRKCEDVIAPIMTKIINMSMESGTVPADLKVAHISPLLKKPNLDAECLKNYRPISNLPFLSKQVERVVASRLSEHTAHFNLSEPFQSAYKANNHSCETALLKVQNDFLRAMDNQKVGVLILLDLSAAFDTVSHCILLKRVRNELRLSGKHLPFSDHIWKVDFNR